MPERLKGADCKSAGDGLRWFESGSTHFESRHLCFWAEGLGPTDIRTTDQHRFAMPNLEAADKPERIKPLEILGKGGRVVQCIRFENGRSLNTTGGSNPPLSLNVRFKTLVL